MEIAGIPVELVISQGIFAVLFVWLFVETRKEARVRENQLLGQIAEQNESQRRIVLSLERLEQKIDKIEGGSN